MKCVEFFPIHDFRKITEFLSALEAFKGEDALDEGIKASMGEDALDKDIESLKGEDALDEGIEDPRSSSPQHSYDEENDGELAEKKHRMPLAQLEEFVFHYAFDTMETSFEGIQVN